jgi:hypothetical protein
MASEGRVKHKHLDAPAGVPPLDVSETRAAQALQAAEESNLDNVRDLYQRSALRWSELADQKIIQAAPKR